MCFKELYDLNLRVYNEVCLTRQTKQGPLLKVYNTVTPKSQEELASNQNQNLEVFTFFFHHVGADIIVSKQMLYTRRDIIWFRISRWPLCPRPISSSLPCKTNAINLCVRLNQQATIHGYRLHTPLSNVTNNYRKKYSNNSSYSITPFDFTKEETTVWIGIYWRSCKNVPGVYDT